MILARDFSWQRGVDRFKSEDPRIRFSELPYGFSCTTPYELRRTHPSVRRSILLRHPITSQTRLHIRITNDHMCKRG